MSTDEAPVTWASMASWYDEHLTVGSGPHELATTTTLQLVSEVDGQTVLDVACGQGMASRALADAGAGAVVGVDATAELLAIAESYEKEVPLGIQYRIDDAAASRYGPRRCR